MDLKDSLVKGGVLIVHQIHEGKHQYDVENVVKYKKTGGDKALRKGDKLTQINGADLQDLTPEELAQMLAEGSPMLTVHKAGSMNEHTEQPSPAEDTLRPVSKEVTFLSFCMEMKKREDFEEEVGQEGEVNEDVGVEEDVCKPGNEENGEGGDLLIVSMTKTSISVVSGRGCEDGTPCQECHGTGCSFNDVVVVSDTCTVTLVPRGSGSFKQEKMSNGSVQHVATHQYIRSLCSQHTLYASPNPEKITIYTYKSTILDKIFRGVAVVLNFTESNCFLRCCKEGERVVLKVETCEKQKLKQISRNDESTLSFVFYMKSDRTKRRKFESALYAGWFIQIVNTDFVGVGTVDGGMEEQRFVFVIQK